MEKEPRSVERRIKGESVCWLAVMQRGFFLEVELVIEGGESIFEYELNI